MIIIAYFRDIKNDIRLDPEYYKPLSLFSKNLAINSIKCLGDYLTLLTDYHANGSYAVLFKNVKLLNQPDYALMIRSVDFAKHTFDIGVKYVSRKAYNFLNKTCLYAKDLIVNKIGEPGKTFITPLLRTPITLGMNLFLIRINEHISSNYLFVFLNTKFGKESMTRNITGFAPPSIDKKSLRKVIIFVPSSHFQNVIHGIVDTFLNVDEFCRYSVREAEKLLTQFLTLNTKNRFTEIVTYQTIINNRWDAEYWTSKHIQSNETKTQLLSELTSYKKGVEVGSNKYCNEGYKFIRVSDITINGIEGTDTKFISKDLFENLKLQYKPSVGEILLTKDASPGVAILVEEETDCIISSGVLRLLLTEKINPYYLEFVLNSQFVKKQIERYCAGSVIVHWKPSQIEKTNIPRLKEDQENEIAKLVQQSHQLRRESKRLLEVAKKAVEIAIEESEEKAMQYLNENQATSIEC